MKILYEEGDMVNVVGCHEEVYRVVREVSEGSVTVQGMDTGREQRVECWRLIPTKLTMNMAGYEGFGK